VSRRPVDADRVSDVLMSGRNETTLVSGFGGQTAFDMSSPPMIGVLPATTVVYILLGLGALLPILLLAVVAVTLCIRRHSQKSSSLVTPVELRVAGYHGSMVGFDDDVGDNDVFSGKKWTEKHRWDETETKPRQARNFDMDYLKRMSEIGGKLEVQSVQNPNVYFRNGPPTKLGAEYRVPSSNIVQLEPDELFPFSNYRNFELDTPPPSCDVTMTSSSRSDAGSDVVSIGPTSGHVLASTGSTLASQDVATLNRNLSITPSILQQEEERVLR